MDKANQIEMRELFLLFTYSGLGLTIRKIIYQNKCFDGEK